ncbi:MAG TPA: carboxypeptidase-like regulatory domain-containing protein [Nitrososphaeraceae archaeon]|nr:carboxypeptidase-like regulatory domain-containing protein [Nitrososphaeraceae archaeon]
MIKKTKILPFSLVIFLSSILLIGIISSSSYAYAQQPQQSSNRRLPPSIIAASTTDTTPHALNLKATQQGEDGQPKKISGYEIDLTNVVTAQINSQVLVFATDSSLQVTGAKIRTVSGQLIDLVPLTTTQANAFSIAGLPLGVYTLDIITQKGNTKAAYEGILVISQQPTTVINETTKNVINQEINQNTRIDTDIRIVFRDKPSPPPNPCKENPEDPDCQVDCELNPEDPDCQVDCELNPDAEGCQEPPQPIDSCEENPSLLECQQETGAAFVDEERIAEGDDGDEGNGDSSDNEGGDEEGGDEEGGGN